MQFPCGVRYSRFRASRLVLRPIASNCSSRERENRRRVVASRLRGLGFVACQRARVGGGYEGNFMVLERALRPLYFVRHESGLGATLRVFYGHFPVHLIVRCGGGFSSKYYSS